MTLSLGHSSFCPLSSLRAGSALRCRLARCLRFCGVGRWQSRAAVGTGPRARRCGRAEPTPSLCSPGTLRTAWGRASCRVDPVVWAVAVTGTRGQEPPGCCGGRGGRPVTSLLCPQVVLPGQQPPHGHSRLALRGGLLRAELLRLPRHLLRPGGPPRGLQAGPRGALSIATAEPSFSGQGGGGDLIPDQGPDPLHCRSPSRSATEASGGSPPSRPCGGVRLAGLARSAAALAAGERVSPQGQGTGF